MERAKERGKSVKKVRGVIFRVHKKDTFHDKTWQKRRGAINGMRRKTEWITINKRPFISYRNIRQIDLEKYCLKKKCKEGTVGKN